MHTVYVELVWDMACMGGARHGYKFDGFSTCNLTLYNVNKVRIYALNAIEKFDKYMRTDRCTQHIEYHVMLSIILFVF